MKDPKKEFHLEKTGVDSWNLVPVNLARGFEHKYRDVQTGEPVSTRFTLNNPFGEQNMQFYISAVANGGDPSSSVSGIKLKINNYQTIELNVALHAGDRIICDGQKVYLCDKLWKKIRPVYEGKIPVFEKGSSEIVVTSDFSGPGAPKMQIEFKTVGDPEEVKKGA
jgi:hypothetical protein